MTLNTMDAAKFQKEWLPSLSLVAAMLVTFMYRAGTSILDNTIRPYTHLAACREMFPTNLSICSSDAFTSQQDIKIQSTAASYLIYYRILQYCPSIILGPFLGAWSDKSGRVLPILLTVIGHVLAVPVYILTWDFPELFLELFITGTALQGVFCPNLLFNTAVSAFVVERVPADDRTKTLSFLIAMQLLGQMTGSLLAGMLQDLTSFKTTLCVASFFKTCAAFITVTCIRETYTTDSKSDVSASCLMGLKESIVVLFKSRKGNSQCKLLLSYLLVVLLTFTYIGEQDITFLYVQGRPLQWTESWLSYYYAAVQGIRIVFIFLFAPMLFRRLSDICIMQIAILLGFFKSILLAFSVASWIVWLSAGIDFMSGLFISIIRSLLSKEVEKDELGKIYSVLGILDLSTRPVASALFASIYANTFNFFPGMAYIVQGFCFALFFMLARVVHRLDAKSVS